MPPPYWSGTYRGYQLVQWEKGGLIEVNDRNGVWIDYAKSIGTAQLVIDGWLNAR